MTTSNSKEAVGTLKEASRLDRGAIAADFAIGILYSISQPSFRDPKQAQEHFQLVLRRFPGYAPALNNLAIAQIRREKYSEALRNLREAFDRSPELEEVTHNLGRFISEANGGRIRPRKGALSEATRLYAKLSPSKEGTPSERGAGWQFIPLVLPNGERESLPSLKYDDHECSACNGSGRMACRAEGCQHGHIHSDIMENNRITLGTSRTPLVVDNVTSTPTIRACSTCGGTGYVRCPYCGGATSRNLDIPKPSRRTARRK
jgi:hypothetical protein